MSLKDFLFGTPKREEPKPGPQMPRPISLRQAPTFQLLPTTVHPTDARVAELWLAFQSQHGSKQWSQFIASLEGDIQSQTKQIADLRSQLANYQPNEPYVP